MAELGLEMVPAHHQKLGELRAHFMESILRATRTNERLNPSRFPGTMALTLSRRHLGMIANSDYVVLEKSDGTRYMLYAIADLVFLIDRLMNFYIVEPHPELLNIQTGGVRHQLTIIDGELVRNQVTQQYEFLVYDAVVIDENFDIAQLDFRERMAAVETYVVNSRYTLPFAAGLLRLRIKDYYEKRELRRLFARIRKDMQTNEYVYINNDRRDGVICNENDGVIFTPVGKPYVVKNCDALLKWKPPHLNSVDFMLKLERTTHPRTQQPSVRAKIAYKGERGNTMLREVHFPSRMRHEWAKQFDRYNESIVELSYDRQAGEWRYIRQRDDKTTPNFSSTVIDTLESIAENMDRDELVGVMEKHSKPPPSGAQQFGEIRERNDAACKVRNDLFDADNKSFLLSTPTSLVAPPCIKVPPRAHRSRHHGARQGRSNHHQGQQERREQREQPDYSADV